MFRLPSLMPSLARVGPAASERVRMQEEARKIDGRSYRYGLVEGDGPTVVLIHGWGLAHSSYKATAEALGKQGFRVIVPDLPGFGKSSDLPFYRISFKSFGDAMRTFLAGCDDIDGEPVHLVGHSFGGAVAAQVATTAPDLVRSVVLVCSAGGATWLRDESMERPLADRPAWDWGVHLVHEFPVSRFPVAALGLLRDLSHNVVWHLPSLGLVANLIRKGDLTEALDALRSNEIPTAVVWADSDHVITRASFEDQCASLGCDGTVVEGNHGWPLAAPAAFGETISEILRSR